MNAARSFLEALESLNSNKLRSGLTILGIVIGVGAVIAMMALGRGAGDTITSEIGGMGTNLLFVYTNYWGENVRNPKPLTISDARAIETSPEAPSVVAVAPLLQGSADVTVRGERAGGVGVVGAMPSYFEMRNYALIEGEFFDDADVGEYAPVALIGPTVADKLFGRRTGIVGETIRIGGQPFRVIGVLASRGGGMFGDEDNTVIIPFSTGQTRLLRREKQDQVDMLLVQVADPAQSSQAIEEVSQILRLRHQTRVAGDDFEIFAQQELLESANTIIQTLTIFLGGIAGISLLVGGIGIMNIMLVSVTERTREIGLRKALGARKRDILLQFLTESSLLSVIGGFIGILLGWLIATVVGQLAAASGNPFTPRVGLDAVLLATLFSAAVGMFFGIYPASRAAKLEPVEALRHE